MHNLKESIPFDQFARYQDLRHLVDLIRTPASGTLGGFRLLDVGGFFQPIEGPPYTPVSFFFPDESVTLSTGFHQARPAYPAISWRTAGICLSRSGLRLGSTPRM